MPDAYTRPDAAAPEAKGDEAQPSKAELKKLHTTAMERFRTAESAYREQMQRELADLKFAARIGQWTDEERESRKGISSSGITLGARPCLTVDMLRQPIQQLENQQRQSNIAVDVHASGGGATAKTAEVVQGLYRKIQVQSRADQIARFWAYSRALKVGRGVYRVEKVYAQPDPDDPASVFDQEIKISRILNQASVLLDPFAQEPDWSDGEWGFVKAWVPKDRYTRAHTDSEMASCGEDEFSLLGASSPGWIKRDGDTWSILEVEYWRVEIDTETVTGAEGRTRTVETRTVFCCKMNAKEITEQVEWDGQYIPLIPVIANEENIDGDRIWEGIVAPSKDACRTENFLTSAFVETVALAPRSPWLTTAEQIGPYKAWWDQSNVRNFPYLPYKAQTEAGNLVGPPERMFSEPPIQAISQGMQMFDAKINAITGFNDPARGNLSTSERSGVALKALQQQTETGNSGYLDNLAQIAMTYEAKVVLDLIPKVYDRPGRIVEMLGIDDAPTSVMLNAPFAKGPEGRPRALPADQPMGPEDAHHDLAVGVFGATVTIGKSHTNGREAAAEKIGAILQAEPQLLMLIGDLYFGNLDGPGMQDIAARLKKMLPPQLQDQEAGGAPDAAKLQQQIAQMGQQIQQMQPLADANQAKLQQAQLDAQSQQQMAAAQLASAEKIAQFEAETKRQIEQIKAQLALEVARVKAMADTNIAAGKAQSDLARAAMQEDSAHVQQAREHAHESALGAADLHGQDVLAHTAQQHERAMADHAVVNRPPEA